MAASGGSVLVLNSGSSSVKFALIAAGTGERLLGGLADQTGRDAAELTETLNTRSGLPGLSGTSNDMRAVQDAAARGDERARLALDV